MKISIVIKNLTLLVTSICIVLLLSEFAVRLRHRAWPFDRTLHVPDHLIEQDRPLRWRYSPSEITNSLGLRNREVGPKKVGIYRILFLGDSLFWSSETSSGELYTQVLERSLNANSPNGPYSYEVINAGIPGYTTYQEFQFLKIYGLGMEPDLVVLGFVFNDLYHKYLHKPTKDSLLDYEPATHLHHFNSNSFPWIIFAKSHLAHAVVWRSTALWNRIFQLPAFPFEQRWDFYLAWKEYGWVHASETIGKMGKLLAQRGINLLIIVFPVSDQVNDKYRSLNKEYVLYPQRMIRKICESYGIRMLDLTDSIYTNGGISLFRDYHHLNLKGNDLILGRLKEFFANEVGF